MMRVAGEVQPRRLTIEDFEIATRLGSNEAGSKYTLDGDEQRGNGEECLFHG